MKNRQFIPILVFILIMGCNSHGTENSAAKKSVQHASEYEDESRKIMELINEEYQAYFVKDYEAWKDKFVHEDYLNIGAFGKVIRIRSGIIIHGRNCQPIKRNVWPVK